MGRDNAIDDIPISKSKFAVPEYEQPPMYAPQQDSNMMQCPTCGRTFNEVAFSKHIKICKKVFVNKRKEFNAQAHRIIEPE